MRSELNHLRVFGEFRLDVETKVLWYKDLPVDLQLKEIELLCVLTETSGNVVTKDELLKKVWADSFVEESNLSRHIYKLRKTFDELGESRELIQTVPRRGYRFTGEISNTGSNDLIIERHSVSQTLVEELEDSVEPNPKELPEPTTYSRKLHILVPVAACLLFVGVFSGVILYSRNTKPVQTFDSIAVLPLATHNGNENDKAIGLGFTDALITRIGKMEKISILSTNAVSGFAEVKESPVDIGKQLGVDAVIDGTIQRANGKIRVTLRLTRVSDGKQIWSGSYDESESNVFRLQDEMARQTAAALALSMAPTIETNNPTDSIEAYNLYLQGEYFFRRRETGKAGVFFRKAVTIDPKFAKAWAGLAATYAMGESMAEAEATVGRALRLDPDLAEAHAVRGFIKMFLDWDWAEAERSLNRAVELDKNSVEAHHWRGVFLSINGKFEEAKLEIQLALALNPTSANLTSDLGHIYYFNREFEKAEEYYLKAMAIEENYGVNRLIELYEIQNRPKDVLNTQIAWNCDNLSSEKKSECISERQNAFEIEGSKGLSKYFLRFYLKSNDDKTISQDTRAGNWYSIALLYIHLGHQEKAIQSLQESFKTMPRYGINNFTLPFINVNPRFDGVRKSDEFGKLLKKLNL